MLRIQLHQSGKECTLKVEGEIEGVAASELESSWRKLACDDSSVIVDFTGVIHVDRGARSLLKSMHENGVKFTGARLAIQDLLDEITATDNDEKGISASKRNRIRRR